MKRHLTLVGTGASVLVLSFALVAQAATSEEPATDETPSVGATTGTVETLTPGNDPAPDATAPSELDTVAPSADPAPGADVAPEPASEPVPDVELPEPVLPTQGAPTSPDEDLPSADVQISLVADDLVPGSVLASGFVPGVETGGTCTLTLSRDGEVRTIEAEAEADATTTVCGGLTMATTGLERGEWSVTLSYSSPTQAGVSDERILTLR